MLTDLCAHDIIDEHIDVTPFRFHSSTARASIRSMTDLRLSPTATGEALKSKSPAEFFADNQNIAGFDNVSERSAG